jgi:hypothetical protein
MKDKGMFRKGDKNEGIKKEGRKISKYEIK